MSTLFPNRRRLTAALLACAAAVTAGLALGSAPAHAAVLFSDDFEQPTQNVWLAGGSWSVVSEDGSKVFKQSSAVNSPFAQAAAGSGAGTVVTARVKPTSALNPSNLVAVTGKVSDPNNLYYVALRGSATGTRLEIGQQAWGRNVPLASTSFPAAVGTWYQMTLSFLVPGTVAGTVAGPGGAGATVSAADPGGTRPGDKVGFYMNAASASFDDIRLSDQSPPTPTPNPPPPCPVAINFRLIDYGGQFLAEVTIRNISAAPIGPAWTMTWRFTHGQVVQGMFNVSTWYMVGPVVTARSPVWFPVLAPGAVGPTAGFFATGPGLGHPPADATFNGAPCVITLS
jgi:hypothetical protein